MAIRHYEAIESGRSPVSESLGLTGDEARRRLAQYGYNRLTPEDHRRSLARLLLRPLADPMVVLLLVAGATYALLRDYTDAVVILVALVPITLVSLVLETRSERTLESLRKLTAPTAVALRDGHQQVVPAEEIVPGDVVALSEGDVIPADALLVQGMNLMVDESALSGESQPVSKSAGIPSDSGIYAGTTVLSGRGLAEVGATAEKTRYGQIGRLLATIEQPPTPLQRLISRLLRQLALGALILCLVVALLELARGGGWSAAVIAGVSLAIAAVPEEFPMVYTLYLSLGAWRLARDRALVRRLAAVETLGSTTVICTDKTGTLTLGTLEVGALATADGVVWRDGQPLGEPARLLLEAAVLACEPDPFDPLDQAILRFSGAHGVDVPALHQGTLVVDYPFDPLEKYVSHGWVRQGSARVAAKGAIEGLLAHSAAPETVRRQAVVANHTLATMGMRVVAVAARDVPEISGDRATDEEGLTFLGLLAFSDPLRPGVREALQACRRAGVRVMMLTGDHPVTAHAVAESLRLPHDDVLIATGEDIDAADEHRLTELARTVNIFARIRPEQKHRLVEALRRQHEVVAMTGDGINDAPALREADIGVAMGRRGTEVARSAAVMVLLDDNFATIVHAIRDGRRIFDNLRRAFAYLIAFHIPLLLPAVVLPLTGQPLLLLPVHLIWLELIVHPTASLVFEADPEVEDLMSRPPRRQGTLISGVDFSRAVFAGAVLAGAILGLYLLRLHQGAAVPAARSSALAALIVGQLILVLLERAFPLPVSRRSLRGNRALPAVFAAVLMSLAAGLFISPVTEILKLAPLSAAQLGLAVAVGLVATAWQELFTLYRFRHLEKGGARCLPPSSSTG